MSLNLVDLDEQTRRYMQMELEDDIANNQLYVSTRLSPQGEVDWPVLLRTAIVSGDDRTLTRELRAGGRLNAYESRRTPSGGMTSAKVPVTAPETLAEGEFNRYYMRGLCRRVLEENLGVVTVYRAKQVGRPRSESEQLIGQQVDPQQLLEDLRINIGTDTALGLPAGPNSGLSVRLLVE